MDVLENRFGRGAARLLIGRPKDAPRLARLARASSRRDRLLVKLPLSAAFLLLLSLSLPPLDPFKPTSSVPIVEPTRLDLSLWTETGTAEPELAEPAPAPVDEAPERIAESSIPPMPDATANEADSVPTKTNTFDPRDLITPTSRRPSEFAKALPAPAPRLAARRPSAEIATSSRTEHLARRLNGMIAESAPAVFDREGETGSEGPKSAPLLASRARDRARPIRPNDSASLRDLESLSDGTSRSAFMKALDAIPGSTQATAPSPSALPPVALRRASKAIADEVRGDLTKNMVRGDWREVPLDALPDCTPRGRQDRLKQEIMRRAQGTPECVHASGEYRFLETRNLNAFLMWSRTNPDAEAGLRGARDACQVLTQALRCLSSANTKEHAGR